MLYDLYKERVCMIINSYANPNSLASVNIMVVTPRKSCNKFLLVCGSKTSLRQPFPANLVQEQSIE